VAAQQRGDLRAAAQHDLGGAAAVAVLDRAGAGGEVGIVVVGAAVGEDVHAARRQRVPVPGEDRGQLGVGDEVQDRDGQQRHRAGQVEQVAHARGVEDLIGLSHVGPGDGHAVEPLDQLAGVGDGDGLEVDVGDAGVGAPGEGDLVDVAHRRHPGAEVEELVDAPREAPRHGAAQEGAVGLADVAHVRVLREDLRGLLTVDREVAAAAEQVVVDPGGVGAVEVDAGRQGPLGLRPGLVLRHAASPCRTGGGDLPTVVEAPGKEWCRRIRDARIAAIAASSGGFSARRIGHPVLHAGGLHRRGGGHCAPPLSSRTGRAAVTTERSARVRAVLPPVHDRMARGIRAPGLEIPRSSGYGRRHQ
jgi:hypothetical protein